MIHMNNVTKVYPNGSTGVENINLHINKGEFVFIVGSSGSGKSTLMKLLLKELDPTEGDIIINKVKTNELNRRQIPYLRRNLGVVFQDFRLLPNKTVYENVAFAMRVIEAPGRIIRRNVPAVLSLVGLGQKGRSYPNQLSGGEQQRTALARIMAYEPDVILLDEPFSALDAYLRERMLTELMEMLSDYEGTVIMVSHSRDEIYSFSEEVLVIEDGHGIRLGPVKEVFNAPRYKTAARLTGCKNIADVCRMDAQTVYVKDWDVQLTFKRRTVSENVKAIGIRAHDLIPVYGTISGAMLKVKEWKSVDYPFERKYFIRCESGCEDFCWFVQREISATLEEKGMPDALAFPEEKVLFLEG